MTPPPISPELCERAKEKLILALDADDFEKAHRLVSDVIPYVGYVKIGYELMYLMTEAAFPHMSGSEAHKRLGNVRNLMKTLSGKILWDAKLNDIPNQIGNAMEIICRYRVRMITVHANTGVEGLRAVVEAVRDFSERNPENTPTQVLAVTLLTSSDDVATQRDFNRSAAAQVIQMASNAILAGADGVVCSGDELELLSRRKEFKKLIKVVSGIRPESFYASKDDHKRVIGPRKAIQAGADYLVVGRPISSAIGTPPAKAAQKIRDEIARILPERMAL